MFGVFAISLCNWIISGKWQGYRFFFNRSVSICNLGAAEYFYRGRIKFLMTVVTNKWSSFYFWIFLHHLTTAGGLPLLATVGDTNICNLNIWHLNFFSIQTALQENWQNFLVFIEPIQIQNQFNIPLCTLYGCSIWKKISYGDLKLFHVWISCGRNMKSLYFELLERYTI